MASSYKVKPANIFGRIGSGIGKGLAEQLPKEIERGRLASGLKNLGQAGGSQYEQIAGLLGTPGVTPEIAGAILPYLQQHLARQEAQKRLGGEQGNIPQQNQLMPQQSLQ